MYYLYAVIPVIQVPKPPVTNLGFAAYLHCPAVGEPKPDIEWRFKGSTIEDSSRYRTFPNGTLVILQTTASDAGQYTCVATNHAGRDTEFVNLIVRSKGLCVFVLIFMMHLAVSISSSTRDSRFREKFDC